MKNNSISYDESSSQEDNEGYQTSSLHTSIQSYEMDPYYIQKAVLKRQREKKRMAFEEMTRT